MAEPSVAPVLAREVHTGPTLADVYENIRRVRQNPPPPLPRVQVVEDPHRPGTLNVTMEIDL